MRQNKTIGRGRYKISALGINGCFLAFLALCGLKANAVPPPSGVAPVVVPAGGFAIDGDLRANTPSLDTGDWLPGPAGTGASVLDANGVPLNPQTTFHLIDLYNSADDDVFVGGLKWTDDPNTWQWTSSKASSKTDINNVLLHVASDAEGHTWLIIAADRLSTSGDSYIDFEFLQSPLTRNANGTFTSAGPNDGRTTNDVLLSLAFTSGGSVPDFFAFRWLPDGSGGFAYSDATASLPSGRVFVAANPTNAAVPFGAFGQTNYVANAFAEAAVDLTALLGNFDSCLSIGIKTIMVKTKSSASSSASIIDFVDPIQYSLKLGPSADAGPDQTRCTEGDSTAFPLPGQATAGLFPLVSTNWSVVSGTATIDAPNALVTMAHVSSTTATLRLTVQQANGCTETDDVVLNVAPLPVGSITGPSLVCPQSSAQFSGPAGMGSYAWSITGNGTISGPTNSQTVAVSAGSACGTNFTLSLAVASNSCPNTCTFDVTVSDTTPPVITPPADVVLECPADTRTNVTGVASALDDCGKVSVSYSDSVTNGCGGTKVIARTWTATDLCGNSASAIQTITVRDTTPPSLLCPANVTLECPADTTTNRTGTATALDGCGSVIVTYSDVVSNSCGGAKVISRLWTATDACGNTTNALQTITVRDTTPPSIVCPANVVLECPADISTNKNGVATALDGCGAVTITYSDVVSNSCGGTKVVSRLWTATDECGNATNALQTITVRDTTPPAIVCPADVVLECPADISTNKNGVATALDACGSATITYSDVVSNSCGGTKIVWRTWTATDACGNTTNALQTLTVRDMAPPTLICPPSVVLECPADISTNKNGVATALDACSSVTVTYSDSISNECGGTKIVYRLWTAADACGNATNALQTITVRDTTPPALVVPANVVLECPADISTNKNGMATALDACGAATVTYHDTVTNTCGGAKIVYRLWTATDACGNATNGLQTITVRDTTPPSLALPGNLVLECGSDTRTNSTGVPIAQDACGSTVLSYSDVVSNSCGGSKTIWRTWTAADACGNSTNGVQTITVQDTTPPALRVPANLVLECPGDTRTNVTGSAVAPDGCSAVTITYSDVVSNSCGSTKTVWRTWTATDACGNSTNGLQTIVVQDTTKPTITCPSISVQCPGDLPPAYTNLTEFLAAGGRASDACSSALTFALISDSGLIGSCPGKVTRVYRVTDECGNYADGTQTITVDDTIAPVLTVPSSVTVECGTSLNSTNTGLASATDNCSTNVTLTYTDAAIGSQYNLRFYSADSGTNTGPYAPTYLKFAPAGLPRPQEALLTGRAADPLRNAVAYGPTAGQLDALTSLNGGSMAFGQIVPFEVVIEASGAPGPERGTIEFTADWATHTTSNDRFGYDTNYMIYCAFVDYADQGTLDPNYNAKVQSFSSRIVDPGSIDEQIEGTFRIAGLDPGDRIVVEIWVVLDTASSHGGGTIAANLVSAQKVTVPPEQITVGVQTVAIGNLNKLNPLPPPQAQPPLGPLPPQPPVPPGGLISVFNRTWTATDDCGNRGTAVQQITVRDTSPPALVIPADLVLEYPADTTTNNTGVATAPDACSSASLSYSDVVTNGCGGSQTVWRTWTATDEWGNTTNAVQTIVVRDSTPPALVCPADVVLECPAITTTNQTGVATATDASGAVTIAYSDSVSNSCGGTRTIWRTWTATNACGNSTNAVQTLIVRDTTPPALTCPADVVLECPADTSTNNTGVATALDTCGTVAISYSDVVSNGTGGTKIIARTWTATDACGNSTNRVQTISVRDTAPPTITYALVSTTTQDEYATNTVARQLLQNSFATVFPTGLVIGVTSPDSTNNLIAAPTSLLWEANAAGQAALGTVLTENSGIGGPITQDAINPTNTFGGGDLALQTIALTLNIGFNKAGMLGTGPNNFGSLIYTSAGDSLDGRTVSQVLAGANAALSGQGLPAGYTYNTLSRLLMRLNQSYHNYTATLWATNHLSAPMLVVQCASQVPPPDPARVTASDTCSSPVTLTSLPDAVTDYVSANHYTVIRTWMATDACGNTNTASFSILINDITPPSLAAAPDRTVTAGTDWDFDQPLAADNCSSVTVTVLNTQTNTTSLLAGETAVPITRTWAAVDAAGNTNTCQQTITVVISAPPSPPTIATEPQSQTIGSDTSSTLSVRVSGTGPFTYQWQLNGTNISGAVTRSLTLSDVQLGNAGLYTVIVGNGSGSVTSQVAVVNILPRLVGQLTNNFLQLTWPDGFILQSARNANGPYTDMVGVTSPYLYNPAALPAQYFRLRSKPFSITATPLANGEWSVGGPGVPGCNFTIQASADLINWVNVATSPSPFVVVDTDTTQHTRRFYRAVLASTTQ